MTGAVRYNTGKVDNNTGIVYNGVWRLDIMPREIAETERHRRSAIEQRRMAIGDPGTWLRIDKGDGFICIVGGDNVARAARDAFKRPNEVIATCRFQTPFAIYCTGDKLTAEERKELA